VAPIWFPVPPTGYGGTERVIALLADGLVAAGHSVTLFASNGSTSAGEVVTTGDAPPTGTLGERWYESAWYELDHALVTSMHAGEFDVIHDHTKTGPLWGAHVATPMVHTMHDAWNAPRQHFWRDAAQHVSLVAISEAQRAAFTDVPYAATVYNGIDLAAHPFREDKDDFFVFIGRTNPGKAPTRAIHIARAAGRPLTMMIKRSEAHERAYWDAEVEPLLGADIEVIDDAHEDVKLDRLSRARALLFPIQWPEPFGLVMTEAMACGTPVIACPIGSVPEVVVDGVTGFIRDRDDDLVDAARRILEGEIQPKDCRQHVLDHFSAERMVARYEAVYAKILTRV
jgi:glycosyltransferase involved in cell wall biosynthesis